MERILRIVLANLVLITVLTLLKFISNHISEYSRVIPMLNVPLIFSPYNFFATFIGELFNYVPFLLIIILGKIQKPLHHSIIYLSVHMMEGYFFLGGLQYDEFIRAYFTINSISLDLLLSIGVIYLFSRYVNLSFAKPSIQKGGPVISFNELSFHLLVVFTLGLVMAALRTIAFIYFSMIKPPDTVGEFFYKSLTAGFIWFALLYLVWSSLARRWKLTRRKEQLNTFMWLVVALQIGFLFFTYGKSFAYPVIINFFSMTIAGLLIWFYQPFFNLFFREKEEVAEYSVTA